MKITKKYIEEDEILEIVLEENLISSKAGEFKDYFLACIEENPSNILLNFGDMAFLDSSGISSLVTMHRKLKKLNITLAIYFESDVIEEVFVLTKLNKLFKIYRVYDEAIDDLLDS
ncbi:MAG: STAS domain-containing protein [Candidatus Cloacimonetes bacterium]|nr:STAS domain-containing protein [Candidatus Cloacimonadota bacterium]